MAGVSAEDTASTVSRTLHDVGSTWMISDETKARGDEYGYHVPGSFYFAGRCGVLGDVHPDVVVAAMGWFEPGLVSLMWEKSIAVAGAREAARQYGSACAAWGEKHLADFAGAARLAELAQRVVSAANGSGLPLFSGWRAEPLVDSTEGRLAQLVHRLREWRGGLHLIATTSVGLSPLAAILTNEGVDQARGLGWSGELPDWTPLLDRHREAEATTDRLSAAGYEQALDAGERAEYVALVSALGEAVLG